MKNKTFALAVLAISLAAPAATLFDNGAYNSNGGNAAGEGYIGDDFVLNAMSDLTGVRFWTLEGTGAYLGSINWEIRANASNLPGSVVASGTGTTPTRSNVGTALSLTVYQNDFSINVAGLGAGTYWLTIHDGSDTDATFQDYYWAWSDPNTTLTAVEFVIGGAGTWDLLTSDSEHAFQILGNDTAVPEPTAGLLLGVGLVTVAAARKRGH